MMVFCRCSPYFLLKLIHRMDRLCTLAKLFDLLTEVKSSPQLFPLGLHEVHVTWMTESYSGLASFRCLTQWPSWMLGFCKQELPSVAVEYLDFLARRDMFSLMHIHRSQQMIQTLLCSINQDRCPPSNLITVTGWPLQEITWCILC